MTPEQQDAPLIYWMICDPRAAQHVVKWASWLIGALGVALTGGF